MIITCSPTGVALRANATRLVAPSPEGGAGDSCGQSPAEGIERCGCVVAPSAAAALRRLGKTTTDGQMHDGNREGAGVVCGCEVRLIGMG